MRDVRLDLFRGLALLFIFLDHMSAQVLGTVTLRNFGFADAAEVFVFISGYAAALAFGKKLAVDGFGFTTMRILKRCWQLYVAHIFLFMVFTAEVAYVAAHFNNPMYNEEMKVASLVDLPHMALMQALILCFRPVYMDILPLYITLLLAFPLILAGVTWARGLTLVLSVALWAAARHFGWTLPSYPADTEWFFNPFAWQLIFVLGALFGSRGGRWSWLWTEKAQRLLLPPVMVWLIFALAMKVAIDQPGLEHHIPNLLERWIFPLDKTNMDPVRLLHFLALAYAATCVIGPQSKLLTRSVSKWLIMCGRHSLEVFCLGTFLAVGCHFLSVELLPGPWWDLGLSLAGIAAMLALAQLLDWYGTAERRHRKEGAAQ